MSQYPFYSVKRLINAFGFSLAGLVSTFKTEAAFRLELAFLVILLPIAIMMDCTAIEKAMLIASLMLILITELINTAIEAVVDRISEERHILSKKAKDAGSAIVLIALINAVCIWAIILIR